MWQILNEYIDLHEIQQSVLQMHKFAHMCTACLFIQYIG